jgi:hypothetical protein
VSPKLLTFTSIRQKTLTYARILELQDEIAMNRLLILSKRIWGARLARQENGGGFPQDAIRQGGSMWAITSKTGWLEDQRVKPP